MVKNPFKITKKEDNNRGRVRRAGIALLVFAGLLFIMQGVSMTGYTTAEGVASPTNLAVAIAILTVSVMLIALSYLSLK